jgi:tyrosyl-tRNA synthetase
MDPSQPSGSSADASASSSSSSSSSAVENLAAGMAAMSLQDRFELLRGIGEECIQEDELMNLLQKKPVPICYDGFEPSGRMHIAQVRRIRRVLLSCLLNRSTFPRFRDN